MYIQNIWLYISNRNDLEVINILFVYNKKIINLKSRDNPGIFKNPGYIERVRDCFYISRDCKFISRYYPEVQGITD